MRLASVEAIPYALPFREPYVTARGTLTQREMVLLRVRDDDGIEGLGEAVPLSLRGGATVEQVVRELEAFAAQPDSDPGRFSRPTRCAVETALWDLAQRQARTARTAAVVECNATLVAGTPAEVAAEAERWVADGYRTFKLKLGTGEDVAQVEAVRAALGADAKIRIDANAAWGPEEAALILNAIEPLGIELAEQPVAEVAEAVALSGLTSIPLAADESVATVADAARVRDLGAFQMTGIKLSKVGGLAEALEIASYLPAYASSALDGPVGIAAGALLANALDATIGVTTPIAHGLATQRLFASTVASVECELRNGHLHPPPGPGLGVVLDEDALQAHRL